MSTVQAFNSMLRSFLAELAETFSEHKAIKVYVDGFDALVAANARKPLELFVGALAPYSNLVQARDPVLFTHDIFPGSGIDMAKLWASDVSDATRDAVWQYIQMLFMLGSTVMAVPPELLVSIESVAHNCAEKIQDGSVDLSGLSSMLMSGLMGGAGAGVGGGNGLGGLGGLGALFGGSGGEPVNALEEALQGSAPSSSSKRRSKGKGKSAK